MVKQFEQTRWSNFVCLQLKHLINGQLEKRLANLQLLGLRPFLILVDDFLRNGTAIFNFLLYYIITL